MEMVHVFVYTSVLSCITHLSFAWQGAHDIGSLFKTNWVIDLPHLTHSSGYEINHTYDNNLTIGPPHGVIYRVSEKYLTTLIAPHFAPNQHIDFASF